MQDEALGSYISYTIYSDETLELHPPTIEEGLHHSTA